mmetsp:Transcript_27112/g.54549  ORF Transcript_27112/g.54549 Transcript_27112/m.54549 type:complete len:113 (-) Transcript_27112:145-483(-)
MGASSSKAIRQSVNQSPSSKAIRATGSGDERVLSTPLSTRWAPRGRLVCKLLCSQKSIHQSITVILTSTLTLTIAVPPALTLILTRTLTLTLATTPPLTLALSLTFAGGHPA